MAVHTVIGMRNAWTKTIIAIIALFVLEARSVGLAISYCSPQNSGADGQSHYSEYQSNGACQDTCQGAYAFAVLQGNFCWCSNYAPSDQVDTLDCNEDCPGFTTEWCGSTQADLFGYYLLPGGKPLGTAGAASASSTRVTYSSSSSSQTRVSVVSSTSTTQRIIYSAPSSSTAYVQSSTYVPPTSYIQTYTNDPATYDSPTSEPTPTAIYTSLVTVPGSTKTVVITPTPTPTASNAPVMGEPTKNEHSGLAGGAIAGVVIGVLAASSVLWVGLWLWFRRRRPNHIHDLMPVGSFTPPTGTTSSSNNIPSRQMSQMSSAGLLGKTPRLQTTGLAPGNDPRSADTISSNIDRRSLGTDQRLNPYAIYLHDEARHSGVSLQDNQDYSRQLRVANPDF